MDETPDRRMLEMGGRLLDELPPATEDVRRWRRHLAGYRPDSERSDDVVVWLACVLALKAAAEGNFGIGCVLINDQGDVVARGHNEVFTPWFRGDRHAEMVVMDAFEDAHPDLTSLADYTLYGSLEPCPMCLTRLINSGVGTVLFATPDPEVGMVHRKDDLPPEWVGLSREQRFDRAECSPDLAAAAGQIALLNRADLEQKLMDRRRS